MEMCLCHAPVLRSCASHRVPCAMRHVPYAMCLCSKVLAMVREMATLAARAQLDYAFMLDYDTVTDTTNPSPDPDPNPDPDPDP